MFLLNRYHPVFIIFLLAFPVSAQQYIDWEYQSSGTAAYLLDVYFADEYTGWAVGSLATILHTSDGGISWSEQVSPAFATFRGISFVSSSTGWIAGDLALIHTTDGGAVWTKQEVGTTMDLTGVHFVDENHGWLSAGENVYPSGARRGILNTVDGGNSWTFQLYQTQELALLDIHFPTQETGCAVGELGAIFTTDDGGNTWIDRTLENTGHLNDVYFPSESIGYISGADGLLLKTLDSGQNWEILTAGTSDYLAGLHFVDNETGWAVGGSNDSCVILGTSDGGVSWMESVCDVPHLLSAVHFPNHTNGWAVGPNGVIVHTSTGGGMGTHSASHFYSSLVLTGVSQNPFSQSVKLFFHCGGSDLDAGVYDLTGKTVRNLIPSISGSGTASVEWDGLTENGEIAANGIYLVRIREMNEEILSKVTLVR